MITLEEKVKEFINTNGIKKKFFANLLGISVAKLSAMLQGKRKMKADELIIFSEYFNLKSDFLPMLIVYRSVIDGNKNLCYNSCL